MWPTGSQAVIVGDGALDKGLGLRWSGRLSEKTEGLKMNYLVSRLAWLVGSQGRLMRVDN